MVHNMVYNMVGIVARYRYSYFSATLVIWYLATLLGGNRYAIYINIYIIIRCMCIYIYESLKSLGYVYIYISRQRGKSVYWVIMGSGLTSDHRWDLSREIDSMFGDTFRCH